MDVYRKICNKNRNIWVLHTSAWHKIRKKHPDGTYEKHMMDYSGKITDSAVQWRNAVTLGMYISPQMTPRWLMLRHRGILPDWILKPCLPKSFQQLLPVPGVWSVCGQALRMQGIMAGRHKKIRFLMELIHFPRRHFWTWSIMGLWFTIKVCKSGYRCLRETI